MPTRIVSIDFLGRDVSASKVASTIGSNMQKAAVSGAVAFDASTSKIGQSFTKLGNLGAQFGVPFAGALAVVGNQLDETSTKGQSFGSTMSKVGGVELLAAGAGLAFVGTSAVHAAENFDTAHARLQQAVANTGQSFVSAAPSVNALDDRFIKLGFEAADTENALSRLTAATHDVGKAQQLMGLAADIARARNVDLTTAVDYLSKAQQGNYTSLLRLGIIGKDAVKNLHSMADVVDYLTGKFGGQAQAYAATFEGKLAALKATANELEVDLGNALIPKIEGLASGLVAGVHGFQDANAATEGFLGKIVGLGVAAPAAFYAFEKLRGVVKFTADEISKAQDFIKGLSGATDAQTAATVASSAAEGSHATALAASSAAATGKIATSTALASVLQAETAAELEATTTTEALKAALIDLEFGSVDAATGMAAVTAATEAAAAAQVQLVAARAASARVLAGQASSTVALDTVSGSGAGVAAEEIGAGAAAARTGLTAMAVSAGTLAVELAAVVAAGVVTTKIFKDIGFGAAAGAEDVKNFKNEITNFPTAPIQQQQTEIDNLRNDIAAGTDATRTWTAAYKELLRETHGEPVPTASDTGNSLGPSGPEVAKLQSLHDAFQSVIKDQGALAARPFFKEFEQEVARIPGAGHLIGHMFDDIKAKIDAASHAATLSGQAFGSSVGVGATQAASAIASYDAQLGTASKITDDTRVAGEQAAVALSGIGVAAGFAAQATVNGMSEAQIAVAGLMNEVNAELAASQSTDSLFSAVDAYNQALKGGSSGGGGGGGQTAAAKALDQAQKELTLRDAQQAVANVASQVTAAQTQLAQARESSKEAVVALQAAETNYRTVLHGVASDSQAAKTAVEALTQAQNDQKGAVLDVADARRALQQARNDQPLAQVAVREAQQQLSSDQASGASRDQIIKDQIALKDARLSASAGNEAVRRAEIALSNALLASQDKTKAAKDAQKALNDTLHGYPPNSAEAKQAQQDLTNAQLNAQQAAEGVTSAQQAVVSAQDQTASSALNLSRAQADLAGQLTSSGGAAGTFTNKALAAHTAADQAKASIYDWAQKQADLTGATKGSTQWTQAFDQALHNLRDLLHPQGELATFMDQMIAKFDLLLHPISLPVPQSGGSAGARGTGGVSIPGGGIKFADGGAIQGNDLSGIPILAHPGEYVIRKAAVDKIGLPALTAINEGKIDKTKLPKFESGGMVDRRSFTSYDLGGPITPQVSLPAPRPVSSRQQVTITIPVTFNGPVMGADVEDAVVQALQNATRRNGVVRGVAVAAQ